MDKQLNKFAIMALIVATIFTNSFTFGMEIKFDDSGITVNGQDIAQTSNFRIDKFIVKLALSIGLVVLIDKYLSNNNFDVSNSTQLGVLTASSTLGSVATDTLYGDAFKKTTLTQTAQSVGTLVGALKCAGRFDSIIKDPAALGEHLGSMAVSELYGDHKTTMLHAGQAIGEQAGMHLFSNTDELLGKALGSSCGAAFVAHTIHDTKTRDFFLKKAAIDTATIQATNKYLTPRYPHKMSPIMRSLANNIIAQMISVHLLTKVL